MLKDFLRGIVSYHAISTVQKQTTRYRMKRPGHTPHLPLQLTIADASLGEPKHVETSADLVNHVGLCSIRRNVPVQRCSFKWLIGVSFAFFRVVVLKDKILAAIRWQNGKD